MEENMVNETEGLETTNITVPDTAEKRFTQEELNEILKKRLSRYKDYESSMQSLDAREVELTAKESWLNCREYLIVNGYPAELLEVIDTSDVDEFIKKADKASGILQRQSNKKVAPLADNNISMDCSGFASAFENTKHTPRQFPPRY